eukprot:gene9703-1908_t
MTTPTGHLKENLQNKGDKEFAVLIGTGSYNPVHIGHIEIFKLAKEELSKQFEILGAYISPSHGDYVRSKGDYIEIEDRLKMIELAIEEAGCSEWLKADPWESSQERFIDYPFVVMRLGKYLKEMFPKEKIRVLYICGSDHLLKCGCYSIRKKDYGVVSIGRPGYKNVKADFVFPIEAKFEYDISSTIIRKSIKNNLPIQTKYEYKSVIDYLNSNDILK